ncbi:MAG TPA: hypothetical protein GX401_02705 [Clostridiales bacterium]|nr:hypothetical protein [Clostridiales bacterium]
MDNVAQWATVICIAAVVCMLFELLSPNGNMEKIMRFVLGLFMLCAIVIPLTQMVFNINIDLSQIDSNSINQSEVIDKVNSQSVDIGKETVISLVKQCLAEQNAEAKKIEVSMDKKEDNSISIVLVTVYLDDIYKEDIVNIKTKLQDKLGIDVKIVTQR